MTPRPRTEAELCDALVLVAGDDGWDVYPEVEGWDLLLVWNGTRKDPNFWPRRTDFTPTPVGYQIAVEAKLRGNCDVIVEALDRARYRRPDEVAVLVPEAGKAFSSLCSRLGLRVFTLDHCVSRRKLYGADTRVEIDPCGATAAELEHSAPRRLPLPAVALQGSGGCAAPRTMSKWRVGALRLCTLLAERGHLTSADFKAHGVTQQRWLDARWIRRDGSVGRLARYVAGPRLHENGPAIGYEAERVALAARDAEAA